MVTFRTAGSRVERRILVARSELEEYLNGATVYVKRLPRDGRVVTTRKRNLRAGT